jgi:metal-responsive CopG/Arc/MetJ family transcriptional regulator
METIQVVLDKPLLRATDRVARRRKVNRSALVREALREYLRQLDLQERERRDREGYAHVPVGDETPAAWERAARWPDD